MSTFTGNNGPRAIATGIDTSLPNYHTRIDAAGEQHLIVVRRRYA
jgi:hypothetical protein